MKEFLKKEKGVIASDGLIAIMILTLFAGIVATILYNIHISNASLKRMSTANLYIVDMMEYIDRIDYTDLDLENDTNSIKQKYSYLSLSETPGTPEDEDLERLWKMEGDPEKGYSITIILDKYKPDDEAQDLIRKITVTVSYKVGNRKQEITMTRLKTK